MDSYMEYFEAQVAWYSTRSAIVEREHEYSMNPDTYLKEEITMLRNDLARLSKLMTELATKYEECY